ncbi:hypothetical protein F6Y02_41185 (plasmid) [Bacillus megaterium]|nr:hypothetical protein [Priestia megaterium]
MERITRIEKLSRKRAREKKKLFRIGGTSLAIITTFTGYGSSNFLSGDRAEAASVQLQENIQGQDPNIKSKKVVKLPDHKMTISTCNQTIQAPVKKVVTSPKQEEQIPVKR